MPGILDNTVALVTGGSRGIGRAIALTLAEAGAHVMISYRSASQEADAVVGEIKGKGGQAMAFQTDISQFDPSREMVETIVSKFQRLDILVNNAGITKDALLMRMSEADWDSVIDTNLKG